MQSERLAVLAPLLKARGHRLFLETNGAMVDALARVLPFVDDVSMDVKLDSVDGQAVPLAKHRRFLALAAERDVYVKIVVGPDTAPAEFDDAVAMVAATAPSCTIYLQPVTPFAAVMRPPSPGQVLELHERALRAHPDVRVVPQTHKVIGQL
jgi:organic radical activating enzyme